MPTATLSRLLLLLRVLLLVMLPGTGTALGLPPNDPGFPGQWNLRKIGVTNVWAETTGSEEVVVAVIDTGVDHKHPDLAPNMWTNPGESGLDADGKDKATNAIDDDQNGWIDDVHGIDIYQNDGDPMEEPYVFPDGQVVYHGTPCASIIGAVGNNALGISGINWRVRIMAIRAWPLSQPANTERKRVEAFSKAFDYVVTMKRRGVNIVATSNSYGITSESSQVLDAINTAGTEGILNVCAAGNAGLSGDEIAHSLLAYNAESIIGVAATSEDDSLRSWSSFGRSTAHLGAPGTNIRAINASVFEGASAAAPHVAGVIALLKAAVPGATRDELKAAILGGVDTSAVLRGQVLSNGRLNAAKALARLRDPDATPIVLSAQPAGPRAKPTYVISLTFSHSMDRQSVEESIRFTPPIDGRFEWVDDRHLRLIPDAPLRGTNYAAVISGGARDARGRPLDGNFNGQSQGTPTDDLRWTFRFPLPNDGFETALPISGETGLVRGTTWGATPQVDEPDHADNDTSAASVWFSWTAPIDGWFTFDTLTAPGFDTILAAYSGSDLAHLTPKAANDDYLGIGSRLSFAAERGRDYKLVVAAKGQNQNPSSITASSVGGFTLSWKATPPPMFGSSPFRPASAAPGSRIILNGRDFTGATAVLFNGLAADFAGPTNLNVLDRQLLAVVPPDATSGPITVVTPRGSVASMVPFEVEPPRLWIQRVSAVQVHVSWFGGGFVLEQSNELRDWVPVSKAEGTNHLLNLSSPNLFYRLRARD